MSAERERSGEAGGHVTPGVRFTAEQLEAVDRREGDLLLDASAGAGKTSVLVERFTRFVVDDGVEVPAILAITYTEKAAAELRDRIRSRLRELGDDEQARATEGAFISTIHGFCARVLRSNALAAGLDPSFAVLDEPQSAALAAEAFDAVLDEFAADAPGGVELIAAYGPWALRGAILGTYAELRSRGQAAPALPRAPATPDLAGPGIELERAAAAAAAELSSLQPTAKIETALARLERCPAVIAPREPWPSDLDRLRLPGGNGQALSTPTCVAYSEALGRLRDVSERRAAVEALVLLDRLLQSFGARYAERKRAVSGIDFADLELLTRDLLTADLALRERYVARFHALMVDELQDTNPVQVELIESIARGNLFTVGDALQSIYGFRHADVELFEQRREQLAARGERATLTTNFRSRREILDAINIAFAGELGERFAPLRAGREDAPVPHPRVELLIADKAAEWADADGLAAPWRTAEARVLAQRVRRLIDDGAAPAEIVLLTRATTDLRAYERALEELDIPTYVIGGRGYWSHPQVVDLVAYLSALANPRDEEALYTVLASPLVGVSHDTLVILGSAASGAGRDPWWLLRDPDADRWTDELEPADRERLAAFRGWFADERRAAPQLGIEDLIERALDLTGYDLAMLALPGGERRLANIRKLMRLGREHEAEGAGDLRGFLELVRARSGSATADSRESEAPVEGEALDAVRLMTIHRAKGLEFPIVCVADLGREPRPRGDLLRLGRDGRIGLRLARAGTGEREPALDYDALGEEAKRAQESEERRLFYVAMTRAQERLILSGAVRLDPWPGRGSSPMWWIGPAFLGELASGLTVGESGILEREQGEWRAAVSYAVVGPEHQLTAPSAGPRAVQSAPPQPDSGATLPEYEPLEAPQPAPPVSQLSYSSLGEYQRCGYRFYLERSLGLPRGREARSAGAARGLSAAERGVLVHTLLEGLDFRRPSRPDADTVAGLAIQAGLAPSVPEIADLQAMVERFAASKVCGRIALAADVRREERFSFLLEPAGVPVTGILDVAAREGNGLLVVDYKSDRLEGAIPAVIVEREYGIQRLVYGLAALVAGAAEVEVLHVFLERPDEPVSARFGRDDSAALRRELAAVARGVLSWDFGVSDAPCREVCAGCPGEDGLCSWPLDMTRREAADRLF